MKPNFSLNEYRLVFIYEFEFRSFSFLSYSYPFEGENGLVKL